MKQISELIFVMLWVAGIVIAKGFWLVFFAIIFPPWGWYLVVERFLIMGGVI